jgi:hypothetical protein
MKLNLNAFVKRNKFNKIMNFNLFIFIIHLSLDEHLLLFHGQLF